jgi:hypothetical protein
METKSSDILLSLQNPYLLVWKSNDAVCVRYEDAYIKDGPFLISTFGKGGTFEGACCDYLSKIRGKTLVFNAYDNNRKEITILG